MGSNVAGTELAGTPMSAVSVRCVTSVASEFGSLGVYRSLDVCGDDVGDVEQPEVVAFRRQLFE